jgi:predicted ribosome-associated RNA-binding protein Tma20
MGWSGYQKKKLKQKQNKQIQQKTNKYSKKQTNRNIELNKAEHQKTWTIWSNKNVGIKFSAHDAFLE